MATVTPSFPCWSNSGQYWTTGACSSMSPRSIRMCAQSDVAPLVADQRWLTVSSCHGSPVSGRATPPHRSMTVSPSAITHTEAPTSPRLRKFSMNSRRTRLNSGCQVPDTSPCSVRAADLTRAAARGAPSHGDASAPAAAPSNMRRRDRPGAESSADRGSMEASLRVWTKTHIVQPCQHTSKLYMRLDMSVPARARPTPLERALGAERSAPRATPLEALSAARRLWSADERLDMGTLAQALRVSRATLYSWVGNRERLIGEVLWSFAEQGLAQARAAARGTGSAYVVDVFQHFIRLNADFVPLRRFIAEDPGLALRILTSKDGPIQRRMIAACRALLEEQANSTGFAPALDLDTLDRSDERRVARAW